MEKEFYNKVKKEALKMEIEILKEKLKKITRDHTIDKDEETLKILSEINMSLSDKAFGIEGGKAYLDIHVKEFIKLLKEEVSDEAWSWGGK